MRAEQAAKSEPLDVVVHPLLALIHLRRARYEDAAREAEIGTRHMVASAPTYYPTLLEYSSLAEVYLCLREHGLVANAAASRAACKRLRAFARVFVVARPAALLWTGVERWLSGRRARALSDLAKSAALAAELGMPYFEALAHYELGRHLTQPDASRVEHLSLAIRALSKLGERYFAALARTELGEPERLLAP